jgi:hypothetical protein
MIKLTKAQEVKDCCLKYFSIAIVFMFLLACSNKEKEDKSEVLPTPENLIAEEKMVLILKDMHIAEAIINSGVQNTDSTFTPDALYNGIYAKHEVNKEDFDNSVSFYSATPHRNVLLYIDVVNALSELNAIMEAKQEEEVKE